MLKTPLIAALALTLAGCGGVYHPQISSGPFIPDPAEAPEWDPDAPIGPVRYAETVVLHTVAERDTVWNIAARYGSTAELVRDANGIDKRYRIRIGDRLAVPMTPEGV